MVITITMGGQLCTVALYGCYIRMQNVPLGSMAGQVVYSVFRLRTHPLSLDIGGSVLPRVVLQVMLYNLSVWARGLGIPLVYRECCSCHSGLVNAKLSFIGSIVLFQWLRLVLWDTPRPPGLSTCSLMW